MNNKDHKVSDLNIMNNNESNLTKCTINNLSDT